MVSVVAAVVEIVNQFVTDAFVRHRPFSEPAAQFCALSVNTVFVTLVTMPVSAGGVAASPVPTVVGRNWSAVIEVAVPVVKESPVALTAPGTMTDWTVPPSSRAEAMPKLLLIAGPAAGTFPPGQVAPSVPAGAEREVTLPPGYENPVI